MPLDDIQPRAAENVVACGATTSCGQIESQPAKFRDAYITATGKPRACVPFGGYKTVWFNTGTLCNIACHNCYIESSPKNDRLVYLTREDVQRFLDEAVQMTPRPAEIGFTGGEPFMNPDIIGMLEDSLAGGFRVLMLTNAMKPMQRKKEPLLDLQRRYPGRIQVRVSIDHYGSEGHEKIRGPRTWQPALDGLWWLSANGFDLAIAGRMIWGEGEASMRSGYRALFATIGLGVDADDPARLTLFPEMNEDDDVPEISEGCWSILGKSPADVMCSSSRMIVKRKGAERPVVAACTLLPYAQAFEMGGSLAEAQGAVSLNHSHCARFCVLGGASCSVQK